MSQAPAKVVVDALDSCAGQTLQERWTSFEQTIWPEWMVGEDRTPPRWRWGTRVIVIGPLRYFRAGSGSVICGHMRWIACLPAGDPLLEERDRLARSIAEFSWVNS